MENIIRLFKSYKSLIILGGFITLLFSACGGNKATADEKRNNVAELIDSREFEIENEWVTPLGGGMINLIGNPNFIRFKGDSLDIFLPYFGVRHSGGGYGNDGGIKYQGPAKNLSVTQKEGKEQVILKFSGNYGNENLDFIITIHSNGQAITSVNSSQRNSISYRGDVRPLTEE